MVRSMLIVLPAEGLNLDHPGPKTGVLPITPTGIGREAVTATGLRQKSLGLIDVPCLQSVPGQARFSVLV